MNDLVIRTYCITFVGDKLAMSPITYTYWDHFWAKLRKVTLPEMHFSDRAYVTVRIQGCSPDFMDSEIAYRQGFHLNQFRQRDPEVRIVSSVLLCEAQNRTGQPLRDFSPGQSPDYRHWLMRYVTPSSGPVLEDLTTVG